MSDRIANTAPAPYDPVSNVLKWVLLAVAVLSFALMAWATVVTYERAPPQPRRARLKGLLASTRKTGGTR